MQIFTYSFLSKIIYRFANILITFFLLIILYTAGSNLDSSLLNLIPFIITALLIYYLNKQYLNLYKLMPYEIEADNEKMKCSNFFLSKKEFTIYYSDISSLSGGIFDGKYSGLMKVCDGKNNICIGFFQSLQNVRALQKLILNKVDRKIYDAAAEKIKNMKTSSVFSAKIQTGDKKENQTS